MYNKCFLCTDGGEGDYLNVHERGDELVLSCYNTTHAGQTVVATIVLSRQQHLELVKDIAANYSLKVILE